MIIKAQNDSGMQYESDDGIQAQITIKTIRNGQNEMRRIVCDVQKD